MSFEPRIPLPNEVPQAPNMSHLPLSVLHKGTVEYLLSQNQDLMSRLSVNIRRITELESQLQDKEEQLKVSKDQASFVSTEMQIGKEHQRRLESHLSETRSELSVLEKRMAEHFSSSSALSEALQNENVQLRDDLFHLQNYRRRVQQTVRPMVDRLKAENEELDARAFRLEVEKEDLDRRLTAFHRYRERVRKFVRPMIDLMREGLKYSQARTVQLEQDQSGINTKLSAAYGQIQKLSQEHRTEQNQLVEHYERRMSELRSAMEKIERDLGYYKKLSDEMTGQVERFSSSQTLSENKSIEIERRMTIFEAEVRKEREQNFQEKQLMNEELSRLGEEIRGKNVEITTSRRALLHSEERLQVFEMENRELRAQLNAFQSLWENNMMQLKNLHAREISLAGKVVAGQSTSDVKPPAELSPSALAGRENIAKIERFLNELQAGTHGSVSEPEAKPPVIDPEATVTFGDEPPKKMIYAQKPAGLSNESSKKATSSEDSDDEEPFRII